MKQVTAALIEVLISVCACQLLDLPLWWGCGAALGSFALSAAASRGWHLGQLMSKSDA